MNEVLIDGCSGKSTIRLYNKLMHVDGISAHEFNVTFQDNINKMLEMVRVIMEDLERLERMNDGRKVLQSKKKEKIRAYNLDRLSRESSMLENKLDIVAGEFNNLVWKWERAGEDMKERMGYEENGI